MEISLESAGAKAIMALVGYLAPGMNYKLFYDNWFSSVNLALQLLENGFHSTATIQINRVKGITFEMSQKDFVKSPRGTFEEFVHSSEKLALVKWNDNRPVHVISTLMGSEPVSEIVRYIKNKKKRLPIQCPAVVKSYNKHMGGVDLADMLFSLYRIDKRSHKYYNRIVYYLFSVCLVCCFLV